MFKKPLKYIGILVSGLVIAIILYTGYKEVADTYYLSAPIENVFEVQKVIIPDFTLGEDPNVVYDRVIHKSFIGDFVVEMKSPIDNTTICYGSGTGFKYSATEEHKKFVNLSWYFNVKNIIESCTDIMPGQYYLETTYTIHIDGLPDRHLTNLSNVFEVLPVKPKFSIAQ